MHTIFVFCEISLCFFLSFSAAAELKIFYAVLCCAKSPPNSFGTEKDALAPTGIHVGQA
jgi:hypothetical protein